MSGDLSRNNTIYILLLVCYSITYRLALGKVLTEERWYLASAISAAHAATILVTSVILGATDKSVTTGSVIRSITT